MGSNLPMRNDAKSELLTTAESLKYSQDVAAPDKELAISIPVVSKAVPKRRDRRAGKKAVEEKEMSDCVVQTPSVEPCLERPRRAQTPNVRLSDYVMGNVMATMVKIPTTYKQA
ncbi:Hypothetical protein PHPALM_17184 [Phytophthora palmivora]|uniref:Uncharacterized protein n=1 Tax=Phytophthora palmivora TaxID=4796 RepID=A0A2P4XMW7_9STRA|nr:Hypothetical protein PHPALM_17184 [Phytophthora palmivora]